MLLQLNDIKKYFSVRKGLFDSAPTVVKAVDRVNFSIMHGENMGLVGESGCGKTTLARMMMRLMSVDSGSILFEGSDIIHLANKQLSHYRKNVQMVFQDPYSSLDPRWTIRSILKEAMTLEPHRYKTEKDKEERMIELLNVVYLKPDMLNRYPHEFSGGERQRIAIARTLMLNPKLLILDEAVSSLDVIIQQQIIDLLKDLQKRFALTYLFISHNLKVVRKLSRRIAVMYQGKIVEIATTEQLFQNPLHPYTKELLMAAINYKSTPRTFALQEGTRLVEQGNGHFVLK